MEDSPGTPDTSRKKSWLLPFTIALFGSVVQCESKNLGVSRMQRKVCIITSVHLPFDIRIFHKEAKSLVKAGYDVTLIAQHDKEETIDGVKIINLQRPRNRIERMTKTIWSAFRKALAVNANIYHLHDPELIPIGFLLKFYGKKVIYDMHENVPKQVKDKHWINPQYRNYISRFVLAAERFLLINIPIIFAENSYRDDYFWVKTYTTVLNMPLIDHLPFLRIGTPDGGTVSIGYIGTVTAERGSLITLQALRILNNCNIKIRFECIGFIDKSHELQLSTLCETYKLSDITFHGYMPVHEAWSIISQCRIGLSILEPIPNSIESYPTKLFEYMAMGLPVICSNFPLYRSVVEEEICGRCVNPLNPEEIAEAIRWLLQNPSEADSMGRNGRKAVLERYNWEIESKKLIKFYKELDSCRT